MRPILWSFPPRWIISSIYTRVMKKRWWIPKKMKLNHLLKNSLIFFWVYSSNSSSLCGLCAFQWSLYYFDWFQTPPTPGTCSLNNDISIIKIVNTWIDKNILFPNLFLQTASIRRLIERWFSSPGSSWHSLLCFYIEVSSQIYFILIF